MADQSSYIKNLKRTGDTVVTDIIIQLEGLLKEDVPSFVKSLKKVRQVLPPSDESFEKVPIFRQKNPGIKSSNTAKPQKVIVDNNTLME